MIFAVLYLSSNCHTLTSIISIFSFYQSSFHLPLAYAVLIALFQYALVPDPVYSIFTSSEIPLFYVPLFEITVLSIELCCMVES